MSQKPLLLATHMKRGLEADEGLLGVGGDEGAVRREDVAPAEATCVREDRAVLAQQ